MSLPISPLVQLKSALDSLFHPVVDEMLPPPVAASYPSLIDACISEGADTAIQAIRTLQSNTKLFLKGKHTDELNAISNYLVAQYKSVDMAGTTWVRGNRSGQPLDENERKIYSAAYAAINEIVYAWASMPSEEEMPSFVTTLLENGARLDYQHVWGMSNISTLVQIIRHHPNTLETAIDLSPVIPLEFLYQEAKELLQVPETKTAKVLLTLISDEGLPLFEERQTIDTNAASLSALLHACLKSDYIVGKQEDIIAVREEIVLTLLKKGASPYALIKSSHNTSAGTEVIQEMPLHRAVYAAPEALPIMLDYLLNNRIMVNLAQCLDGAGCTPLDYAVKQDAHIAPLIEFSKSQNTDPSENIAALVNHVDNSGRTALYFTRSVAATTALVEAGADLQIQDPCGLTPAHAIAFSRIRNGADILKYMLSVNPNLLHLSVPVLPETPANEEATKATRQFSGKTLLHLAAERKSENGVLEYIVERLRTEGSAALEVALSTVDESGYTPLSCAVAIHAMREWTTRIPMPASIVSTFMLLLDNYPAAANPKTADGRLCSLQNSPLYHALNDYHKRDLCDTTTTEALMLKIIEKTDLSASRQDIDVYGPRLLCMAARTRSTVLFEALVGKGLSPNSMVDPGGISRVILFEIIQFGTIEMLEHTTIQLGINPSEENILHCAIHNNRPDMLGALLKKCSKTELEALLLQKSHDLSRNGNTKNKVSPKEAIELRISSMSSFADSEELEEWRQLLAIISKQEEAHTLSESDVLVTDIKVESEEAYGADAAGSHLLPLYKSTHPDSPVPSAASVSSTATGTLPNAPEHAQEQNGEMHWYSVPLAYTIKLIMLIPRLIAFIADHFSKDKSASQWVAETRAQRYVDAVLPSPLATTPGERTRERVASTLPPQKAPVGSERQRLEQATLKPPGAAAEALEPRSPSTGLK